MKRRTLIEDAEREGEGPERAEDDLRFGGWRILWGTGVSTRGGTIGHIQDSMLIGRRGEAGHLLGTNRSGGEYQWIDRRAVSEEAAKVIAGTATATVTATATDAKTMMEG